MSGEPAPRQLVTLDITPEGKSNMFARCVSETVGARALIY